MWVQKTMNHIPVAVAVNDAHSVTQVFLRVSHRARYCKKVERTEALIQLAEAGYHDRLLKKLFFKVH